MKWFKKKTKIYPDTEPLFNPSHAEVFADSVPVAVIGSGTPGGAPITPLNIPINIQIDGKEPEPLSDEHEQEVIRLAKNEVLLKEVERYLGEQFKLSVGLPKEHRDILDGKIMGVSEFYRQLLDKEFLSREGIENKASEADSESAGVDPS